MSKVCCQERGCGWKGDSIEQLIAPSPFDEDDMLYACPKCKTVETSIWAACDEPDCWRAATCGTPTPDGYRNTCGDHIPKVQE